MSELCLKHCKSGDIISVDGATYLVTNDYRDGYSMEFMVDNCLSLLSVTIDANNKIIHKAKYPTYIKVSDYRHVRKIIKARHV